MAKIKGICRNEDCDLCNHIQEADKTDFICGLCHEPLIPFDGGPGSWWKRYKQKVLIGGAAVLLGGGGAATYFLMGDKGAAAENIRISSPVETAGVGDKISLSVNATPADAEVAYIWRSSDERIATVIPQGDKVTVELKEQGEVCVYVQVKGQEALKDSCLVDVTGSDPVLTNWISIMDGKALSLELGGQKTLSLDCDPGNANEAVAWSSSNENVATVVNGMVTAIGRGKATITATTAVKKNTAHIEVTVQGNAKPGVPPQSGEVTLDLGFATYKGSVQNGKPHGSGTMTFKQEAVVPGAKGNIKAKAGDYVQGEWRNGEVNLVRLHQQGNDPQVITHK
ncbi:MULTISPECIES: Ig-like domain-containing protein [Bacteroidales]|nr:Ig-like domain-containing protein [Parabacteroides merdae]